VDIRCHRFLLLSGFPDWRGDCAGHGPVPDLQTRLPLAVVGAARKRHGDPGVDGPPGGLPGAPVPFVLLLIAEPGFPIFWERRILRVFSRPLKLRYNLFARGLFWCSAPLAMKTTDNPGQQSLAETQERRAVPQFLPLLAEIWIVGIIITFLAIRIIGSNSFQPLLRRLGH
jgi:hypothetical protein